jgi:hypothetical protein
LGQNLWMINMLYFTRNPSNMRCECTKKEI